MPSNVTRRSTKRRTGRARKSGSTTRSMTPLLEQQQPASWNVAVVDRRPARVGPDVTYTRQDSFQPAVLQANTGDTVRAFYISLSSFPNASQLGAIYNKWRVKSATFNFLPYATTASPTSGAFPGIIGTWTDTDDANLPANMAEGQRYKDFQINTANIPFTRTVWPKLALATYSGAFTSYATPTESVWADCDSPNVQFYGLKSVITASNYATPTNVYSVWCSCVLQFKDPR